MVPIIFPVFQNERWNKMKIKMKLMFEILKGKIMALLIAIFNSKVLQCL